MEQNLETSGLYHTQNSTVYEYRVEVGDWDLDHPRACLFTFFVTGPNRSFEKVIAVEPEEVDPYQYPGASLLEATLREAENKLFDKLEDGNEADEPTPLR